jgi:hypothetical protein
VRLASGMECWRQRHSTTERPEPLPWRRGVKRPSPQAPRAPQRTQKTVSEQNCGPKLRRGKRRHLRASGDLSDSRAALFLTGAKGWQPASCGRTKPF